jgi:hypothetical protein
MFWLLSISVLIEIKYPMAESVHLRNSVAAQGALRCSPELVKE